ncbi:MAG: ATPase P [Aliifodinibius sp.]|nr:ATPase P [Fodinibius sp.]NIV13677.1 ATPase P [Fodinibius sp.]NIY27419.1 ATPase P [Fodinibius sp.]
MIHITIPGFNSFDLEHLVLDFNGTMAIDGNLIDGVTERLFKLAKQLSIHVLTADTFGKVQMQIGGLPLNLHILKQRDQAEAKRDYIRELNPEATVSIGNGRNDRLMLEESALGIAVMQKEGTAYETLSAADVVVPDILSGLELLQNPLRLKATLRS